MLTLQCVCAIGKGMNMPRVNKPVNTTIPPDLLAEVDDWIAAQPIPPKRSQVIVAALRLWLDAQSGNSVQNGGRDGKRQ